MGKDRNRVLAWREEEGKRERMKVMIGGMNEWEGLALMSEECKINGREGEKDP